MTRPPLPSESGAPAVSLPVLIELVVGEPLPDATTTPLSLAEAAAIAEVAQQTGVTAIRLVDAVPGVRVLDPSVVASYLAGRVDGIGFLVDVPTSRHAPYNVARRVLSFDRATAGQVGVVLGVGDGDEVSEAAVPDPTATDPAERWSEYADVLRRLWESFPRQALIGDRERAIVVDDTLLRRLGHVGRFYRVAGPLDGPSSVQGRPLLVAADPAALGWTGPALFADVVIVDRDSSAADLSLTSALERIDRPRDDVALLGRTVLGPGESNRAAASGLTSWISEAGLDGLVLAPDGTAAEISTLISALVPLLAPRRAETLRAALIPRSEVSA